MSNQAIGILYFEELALYEELRRRFELPINMDIGITFDQQYAVAHTVVRIIDLGYQLGLRENIAAFEKKKRTLLAEAKESWFRQYITNQVDVIENFRDTIVRVARELPALLPELHKRHGPCYSYMTPDEFFGLVVKGHFPDMTLQWTDDNSS